MRRLSGLLLAGAILLMPALSQGLLAQAAQPQAAEPQAAEPQAAQPAAAAQESSPLGPPINYTGEVVIAAYTVNPGKDADYEKVIATLKDALQKSTRPEAKQQLAGWQVIKNELAQGDGSSLYVHIIKNVPNADYSITNLVYEVNTDPAARTAFYELYRGALQKPIFVIQGPVTADLGQM